MQDNVTNTTSEEDTDNWWENDENDDESCISGSGDDNATRTETYLRLYFNSLSKSGKVKTVEEEFNLVTAKLEIGWGLQKTIFFISYKDQNRQGIITQIIFQDTMSQLSSR